MSWAIHKNVARPHSVLFCNSLLDKANDDHENGAANAGAGHIANKAADIEAARLSASSRCSSATEYTKCAQELATEAATRPAIELPMGPRLCSLTQHRRYCRQLRY
jgi:hypothetical protein